MMLLLVFRPCIVCHLCLKSELSVLFDSHRSGAACAYRMTERRGLVVIVIYILRPFYFRRPLWFRGTGLQVVIVMLQCLLFLDIVIVNHFVVLLSLILSLTILKLCWFFVCMLSLLCLDWFRLG